MAKYETLTSIVNVNQFISKNHGIEIPRGEVLDFTGETPKRINELVKAGALKALNDEKSEIPEKYAVILSKNAKEAVKAITADLEKEDLDNLHKYESDGGKRKTVLDHIEAVLAEKEKETPPNPTGEGGEGDQTPPDPKGDGGSDQ